MNFTFDFSGINVIADVKGIRTAAVDCGFSLGLKDAKDIFEILRKAYNSSNIITQCNEKFVPSGSRFFLNDVSCTPITDYDYFCFDSYENINWLIAQGFSIVPTPTNYRDAYITAIYRRPYESTHIDVQCYPEQYFNAKVKANALIKNLKLYSHIDKLVVKNTRESISQFWTILIQQFL
jgi:hypothetical protein